MTDLADRPIDPADLAADGVHWDLDTLLGDAGSVDELMRRAAMIADELESIGRGRIATMTAAELGAFHRRYAELLDLSGRASSYAGLRFSTDTTDPTNGALMARVEELDTAISTRLLFVSLEWVDADDAHVEAVLSDPTSELDFVRHHLRSARRHRPHVLSEPEEKIMAEKSNTGWSAWGRLFDELCSAIQVTLPEPDGTSNTVGLMQALSRLQSNDRAVREGAHGAVTAALEPGLRTRAYVFNTLLNDKTIDDRLRSHSSWISSRNLANEASDESVQALIDSVVNRYDIPQRWYALKARILGVDKLRDYDRMASVAASDTRVPWSVATETVFEAYASFSGELASIVQRFLREGWIDAPNTPGKRPGAFCAYTVPSHHPYLLLNWAAKPRDVATLAHELGHGVHAYLSREQGPFQFGTPLTLAETASVFGECVTSRRVLAGLSDPNERLALLAATLEDSIATVFRQVAMNRFEHGVHTARRTEGELAVDRFNEIWAVTQGDMLGDAVEITEGYRTWWSYIPHFVHTPGYVYAYSYGQLLALSVYRQYDERGDEFVPQYLELLRSGGSMSPEALASIVDCDLADPSFWDGGLAIIDGQLHEAEAAAQAAGRL
jgi:oligoendopeptidase F